MKLRILVDKSPDPYSYGVPIVWADAAGYPTDIQHVGRFQVFVEIKPDGFKGPVIPGSWKDVPIVDG